jgi:hypothetical protein
MAALEAAILVEEKEKSTFELPSEILPATPVEFVRDFGLIVL